MLPLTLKLKTSEPSIRVALLMVLLYLILPVQALLPIDDPDVWWRFQVGEWIMQNDAGCSGAEYLRMVRNKQVF